LAFEGCQQGSDNDQCLSSSSLEFTFSILGSEICFKFVSNLLSIVFGFYDSVCKTFITSSKAKSFLQSCLNFSFEFFNSLIDISDDFCDFIFSGGSLDTGGEVLLEFSQTEFGNLSCLVKFNFNSDSSQD